MRNANWRKSLDHLLERRWETWRRLKEYMTIFINGKQKRVKRPPTIDGLDVDEFIRRNAEPVWLHQNRGRESSDFNKFWILPDRVRGRLIKPETFVGFYSLSINIRKHWIPAFAGMTEKGKFGLFTKASSLILLSIAAQSLPLADRPGR